MEYVKGNPNFVEVENQIKSYPYLNKDISCEVLIIGGGIDGAIANFYISSHYDTILVDKSRFRFGCTSCATSLLEYQLDDFANDLKSELMDDEIVEIYKMGLLGIKKLENFIKKYGNFCNFSLRPILLYTDSIFNTHKIYKEYEFRKERGFDCVFFDEKNSPFSFKLKAGLYAENGGAECNPYLLTKQMIENSKNQDKLFENTKIEKIIENNGEFIAFTSYNNKIFCKKIVVATGFNFDVVGENNLTNRTISYTIVSEPIKNFSYFKNTLIHDIKNPYHYLRIIPTNQIIFGGEDTKFKKSGIDEKLAQKKYNKLEKDLKKLFPHTKIKISNKFCGAFASTSNNLGLIGETGTPNIYYFLSAGANGIVNAMFGTEILLDEFCGKINKFSKIFSPKRK